MVVADVRRTPKLNNTTSVFEKLDAVGAAHEFIETDVLEADSAREAVEATAETFGGLDILVNNAGVYYQNPVYEAPAEE